MSRGSPATSRAASCCSPPGLGIGRRAAEQRRYVEELSRRGVTAVAIELGGVMSELPRALVERAEQLGLPVIALRRERPVR